MNLSSSTLQKNRVYAPIITGFAIILAVAFGFPIFSQYSDVRAQVSVLEWELATIQDEQKKLQNLKENQNPELASQVQKIGQDFVSSQIIRAVMDNKYTARSLLGDASEREKIFISQISLNKGQKELNWLYRGTVNVSIEAKTPQDIIDFVTYLTKEAPFAFVVNSINIPDFSTAGVISSEGDKKVTLPVTLGVYYYQ